MGRPKEQRITRLDYCQYLLSSQINYTLTNFAEHLQTVSHDTVNRYLRDDKLTPRLLWEHTRQHIVFSEQGYIVFDDSVLDKNHSKNIGAVRWQYSGNTHRVIKGIGLVNCIYINPETSQYWAIDYRIFSPDCDGKSKMDHVQEMLTNVLKHKQIPFKAVLIDSWYASNKMMLFISDAQKLFYCPIKKNRLVGESHSPAYYQKVSDLPWSEEELSKGKLVRLKGMPRDFSMKMFRVPITTNRTDYVVTNDPSQHCSDDTQKVCAMRWYIEQFHREVKQLTGIEACQCRKARIQRNHIACALLVWTRLNQKAKILGQTVYQLKQGLLKNYLINELRSPTISMNFA